MHHSGLGLATRECAGVVPTDWWCPVDQFNGHPRLLYPSSSVARASIVARSPLAYAALILACMVPGSVKRRSG